MTSRLLPLVVLALVSGSAAQNAPSFLERAMLTTSGSSGGLAAVAVSGDIVVVGDYESGFRSAVLVFEKPATGWTSSTHPAVLTASDGYAYGEFGLAVAIDGDTIVVGASRYTGFGTGTANGAAYIYERPAGGWADMTETVRIGPCCAGGFYQFGSAVAVDGDTIVVGADQEGWGNPGGAHVFERPAGASWEQVAEVARFAASDGSGGDGFGSAVAVRGDVVVVGAKFARAVNPSGVVVSQGAAYVFEKPPSGWLTNFETAKLTASNASRNKQFGISVALADGYIAVGADRNNNWRGAVYIFDEPASGWSSTTEDARLRASDGAGGDLLGGSIAVDGDRIVAGASGSVPATTERAGAVYVFDKPAGGWTTGTETAKLTLGLPVLWPTVTGAAFGNRVGLGGGSICVLAPYVAPVGIGATFVFDEPPVAPGSGCGLADTALAGSTRIGQPFDMSVAPCAGGGAPEFILGVPLAQPFSFPQALSCTAASPCLLSCNPVIRIPASGLSLTWANDPALVGIAFCVQSMCLDPAAPCLEISDQVIVTITG